MHASARNSNSYIPPASSNDEDNRANFTIGLFICPLAVLMSAARTFPSLPGYTFRIRPNRHFAGGSPSSIISTSSPSNRLGKVSTLSLLAADEDNLVAISTRSVLI